MLEMNKKTHSNYKSRYNKSLIQAWCSVHVTAFKVETLNYDGSASKFAYSYIGLLCYNMV